jgi:hypothetical protein
MTSQVKLVQQGVWPTEAAGDAGGDFAAIALSSTNSQTATVSGSGTTQTSTTASTALAGTTYQMTNDIVNFTTVGTTYNTAQLTNQGSAFITVFNSGANTMLVYPPLSGTINGQAINIPFGVGANKSTTFISPDGITWFAAHAG